MMKKILCALLVVFAISSNVNATEYDFFVGVDAGLSKANFTDTTGSYDNDEISTYGVKIGAVNDNTRIYLSYQYMDAFEASSSREGAFHALAVNTEAFSEPYNIFDSMDHIFFIGGHLGAINLDVEASFGNSNEYGVLYGLQGGVLTTFGPVVSLELGYRYSRSTFSDQAIELDKLQAFYAGINLRF